MTNLYDPKTDTGVGVVYGQDGNNAQGKVISGQRQDPPTKTRTITPHSGSAELREAGVNSYADTLDVHEVGKHLADGTTGEVDRNGNVTVYESYSDAFNALAASQDPTMECDVTMTSEPGFCR